MMAAMLLAMAGLTFATPGKGSGIGQGVGGDVVHGDHGDQQSNGRGTRANKHVDDRGAGCVPF